MAEIKPKNLANRLDDNKVEVVDIRHKEDFEDWHIPESQNVDVYDELKEDPDEAKEPLEQLPDDKEIVTVCGAGVLAEDATQMLENMGYDAKTLENGMEGWGHVHLSSPLDVDIEGELIQVTRPGTGCLSHVLISDGEAAVFDPSQYLDEYESIIDEHDAELVGVFDTHAHADHISGGRRLAERNDVSYYLHPKDDIDIGAETIEEGDSVRIGDVGVEVVHTPGHSPGSVTFDVEGKALITGDTLFHESVGRVELGVEAGLEESSAEENAETLFESIKKLLARGDDPLVLPAHDPGSPFPPVTSHVSEVTREVESIGKDRDEFVKFITSNIPDQPPNYTKIKKVNLGIEEVDDKEKEEVELGPNRCAAE